MGAPAPLAEHQAQLRRPIDRVHDQPKQRPRLDDEVGAVWGGAAERGGPLVRHEVVVRLLARQEQLE